MNTILWILFVGLTLVGLGLIFDYLSSSGGRRNLTFQVKCWLWVILLGLTFICFWLSASYLSGYERQQEGSVRFWFGLSVYPSILTAAFGYVGVRVACRSLIAAILSLISSAVGWLVSGTVSLALLFYWGESASKAESSSSGSGLSDVASGLLLILAWITFVAAGTGVDSLLIVSSRKFRQ